ncbi:BrnT family toxin [[Scytonema hofmanni] UTEX B 1581]|uniref:BrnT family toxin n=1 Tax=[Scytonema hofmanni] UTEX B 1581 TaxID=379535 RepID=UPI00090781B8
MFILDISENELCVVQNPCRDAKFRVSTLFSGFEARVIVIVHTERDNVIRIISARKATKNEEIRYFQQIAD